MKTILLTGDEGYLGSMLKEKLVKLGYVVRCFDLKNAVFQDIRNYDMLEMQMAGGKIDYVIHLAGIVGDPNCAMNINLTYQTNVIGTRNVIRLCKEYNIPLLFASSCSVYGKKKGIVDENDEPNPISLYALTKQMSEDEIKKELDSYIICRFGTLFGDSKRMRFDLVINDMCKQAVEKGELTIFGGKQRRPFISVDEVSNCIIKILDVFNGVKQKSIFNLVAFNMSILDVGKKISKITGCNIKIEEKITDARDYAVDNIRFSNIYFPINTFDEEVQKICQKVKEKQYA